MSIVREKREQAALGQEQLAREAGISVYKLSRIELGRQPLQVPDAIALAKVLRCDPTELFPELREAMTPPEEVPAHGD
jgi:transcriptional regulator with XRE-family HTH domain